MLRSTRNLACVLAVALGSGCGAVTVVVDLVAGWLSDDDEVAESEPTGAASSSTTAAPAGAETGRPPAGSTGPGASSEGDPTGRTGSGDGGDGSGGSSAGTTVPASFPLPPTTSDTAGTGGAESGDDTGEGSSTGPGDTGATAGTPPPAGSTAACLEGTWEIADFDTYLRARVRRHTRGRKVKAGKVTGTYELSFDAKAKEVTIEAKGRVHRYHAALAGVDIDYAVRISGTLTTAYDVGATGELLVDPSPAGTSKLGGRLSVDIAGEKQVNRTIALPIEGRFEVSCSAADLALTELASAGRKGKPVAYRRK